MKATRYYSIGSDPQNDLQLAAASCAPFHLLLCQDPNGSVWVSSRTAQARYHLNGHSATQTSTLEAGDELFVGPDNIDWMHIFGISPAEIAAREVQNKAADEKQKGLSLQLIFIYIAIALILFLMAFYI
jgi:hypothetical protein